MRPMPSLNQPSFGRWGGRGTRATHPRRPDAPPGLVSGGRGACQPALVGQYFTYAGHASDVVQRRGTTRNIMMSWSVLETRCMYYNIMGYRGIPCNRVEYRSVGKVIAYTGISWSVEQFSGIIWNTMISWFVCLGSSLTILEYHGISRGIIEHNEN